jgi:hypothetical protein
MEVEFDTYVSHWVVGSCAERQDVPAGSKSKEDDEGMII